jgi:thiosulfate/3-mercaptopyruvate sulfurtransferase
MPHALSLPFTSLLTQPSDAEPYRKYLSPDKLEKVFLETLNHDHQKWEQIKAGQKGVVVSCGSGMTACIIWLAIRLCSPTAANLVSLYDESWTGYALRKDAQIIKDSPTAS